MFWGRLEPPRRSITRTLAVLQLHMLDEIPFFFEALAAQLAADRLVVAVGQPVGAQLDSRAEHLVAYRAGAFCHTAHVH